MFAIKERTTSSIISLTIRITGSAGLIFWIFNRMEWKDIIEVVKEGSPFYIVAAVIAIQLTAATSVWKWKKIVYSSLSQHERGNASVMKLGRFYYIGLFFNNFLPGSVGGDVIRVFYLGKITGIPIATASVALERLTSGAALVLIAILSIFSMDIAKPFLLSIFLVTGLVLLLFLLIGIWIKKGDKVASVKIGSSASRMSGLIEKVKVGLSKISAVAMDYRKEDFKWWISVGVLSIFFQVGLAWINQLLFMSLGIRLSWIEMLMIITLISVITMLPVSVNGIGIREGCYVFFFKELGVSDEIAVSVSLLFFFLVTLSSIIGGVFWMLERGKRVEAIRKSVH